MAWPLVEGFLARDMSLRVPVARLEAVSVNAQPSDKQALQEAAVAATEATVKNFRDHQGCLPQRPASPCPAEWTYRTGEVLCAESEAGPGQSRGGLRTVQHPTVHI